MKKKRYTDTQIAFALRQSESGVAVGEIVRKMWISEVTFCRWKQKFDGSSSLKRKTASLKQLVADLSPDKAML